MARLLLLIGRRNLYIQSGFTFIELLIVIVIVGILSTMALSSWNGALARWQVTDVQHQLALAIRQTQMEAQNNKINWQFSIHETVTGEVRWSCHSQTSLPTLWRNVGGKAIDIDLADTTLDSSNGSYYIRFDYKGNLASRTRTLALTHQDSPKVKRCLVMSTILGEIRLASENANPNSSGRYCY